MSDYRMEMKPACPNCGYEIDDIEEIFNELEGETEADCDDCEQTFAISRSVFFYYSASKDLGEI